MSSVFLNLKIQRMFIMSFSAWLACRHAFDRKNMSQRLNLGLYCRFDSLWLIVELLHDNFTRLLFDSAHAMLHFIRLHAASILDLVPVDICTDFNLIGRGNFFH